MLVKWSWTKNNKVLYVSGEESTRQLKLRADRIGISNNECYILSETSLEQIYHQAKDINPDILVIDSIQTIHLESIDSSAGSLVQVRECTASLLRYAKQTNTPIFLVGHITKDGNIAGPKILEHIVDTVLQFEAKGAFCLCRLVCIQERVRMLC